MLFPRFFHVEVLVVFPVEDVNFPDFSLRVELDGFQVDVILGLIAEDGCFHAVCK